MMMSGDDVYYSMVFDTLVGLFVFSVMVVRVADDICY